MDHQVVDFSGHGLHNTPMFTLSGLVTLARVVDIIDGDTLGVIINIFGGFHQFRVRLVGINCAELDSKDVHIKAQAYAARYRLFELITGVPTVAQVLRCSGFKNAEVRRHISQTLSASVHTVLLACGSFDCFGRLLADVYLNSLTGPSLSQELIAEGLACARPR